jgi:hypothetical protein
MEGRYGTVPAADIFLQWYLDDPACRMLPEHGLWPFSGFHVGE